MPRRQRNTKVALKHGFEGPWERILLWQGWRVVRLGCTTWRTVPLSSPRVLRSAVLWTGMHSTPCVTLPKQCDTCNTSGREIGFASLA